MVKRRKRDVPHSRSELARVSLGYPLQESARLQRRVTLATLPV